MPKHLAYALVVGWVVCLVVCWSAPAAGQAPAEAAGGSGESMMPRAPEPAADAAVRRTDLPTYYMFDDDGLLVPVVLGFSYDELLRLYNLDRGLQRQDKPPSFVIDRLEVDGVVEGDRAYLEAEVLVRLVRHEPGWIRVPLGFARSVLTEPIEHEGAGEFFAQYDAAEQSYVAWLQPELETAGPPLGAGRSIPAAAGGGAVEAPAERQAATTSGGEASEAGEATDGQLPGVAPGAPPAAAATAGGSTASAALRPPGDAGTSVHRLRLKMAVPVVRLSDQRRVELSLPRAVASVVRLDVPMEHAEVAMDTRVATQTATEPTERGTLIRVEGLAGETQIAWQPGSPGRPAAPPVLEARGSSVVRIIGQQQVIVDARLEVISYGGPIDHFLVRLPPRMQLTSLGESQPESQQYQVSQISGPDASERQIVEVKLNEPSDTLRDVHLRAALLGAEADSAPTATEDGPGRAAPIELGGFQVVEADIQFGHVELVVEGEWSVRWEESQHVRRTEQSGSESVARFEYSRQPYQLAVYVLPKERRVSVDPSYEVLVEPGRMQLDAVLTYRVRGARAYQLEIELGDWQVEQVGDDQVVQFSALETGRERLVVPLVAQATPGQFELQLTATRDIPADAREVDFSLPRPLDASVAAARLVVRAADNVELTPRSEEIRGLESHSAPPGIEPVAGPRNRWYYQERRADDEAPAFVGGYRVRPRSVSVDVAGQLQLERDRVVVVQRLDYRIAYEPLDALRLQIPPSLLERDLEIVLSDESQPLELVVEEPVGSQELVPVRVDIGSRLGRCELRVRYELPLEELSATTPLSLALPLVVPSTDDVLVGANRLQVRYAESLLVEPVPNAWSAESDGSRGAARSLLLTAAGAQALLPLQVTLVDRGNAAVVLDQAWVQTWLTRRERRDRVVLRVRTRQRQLTVELPAEATRLAEVTGNRRLLPTPPVDERNRFTIQLPASESPEHVVEFWYAAPTWTGLWSRAGIQLPRLHGATGMDRWYWQLITPADTHLVKDPRDLLPQLQWRWRGSFWSREAALAQTDLERMLGASSQQAPAAGVNQYLYASFGPIEPIDVVLVRRGPIVFAASLVALLAGLLLIYMPGVRHPALLLVVGVVVLAVGLLVPGPALLAAQAAALGAALILLARLLSWLAARRRLHDPARSLLSDSQTRPRPAGERGSSHASTAAAPLSMQLSRSEPKS